MKKLITLGCSAFLFLSLMQSCQKSRDGGSKYITIDTTIASGVEYKLNLQQYGDADDEAFIRKQATNYTTSEITNTAGTFSPVYHYAGLGNAKLTVTDQVVLAVVEGSRNGNPPRHTSDSTVITINFKVQ